MAEPSKTGITAVVWDLDGTMVDSAADIAAALNRLLSEDGLPELDDERIRGMIGEGVPTLIRRGLAAHDVTADEQRLGRLVENDAKLNPHSFSIVHCSGCWCCRAKLVTCATLVSATSYV